MGGARRCPAVSYAEIRDRVGGLTESADVFYTAEQTKEEDYLHKRQRPKEFSKEGKWRNVRRKRRREKEPAVTVEKSRTKTKKVEDSALGATVHARQRYIIHSMSSTNLGPC